jgi:hypothetical protein
MGFPFNFPRKVLIKGSGGGWFNQIMEKKISCKCKKYPKLTIILFKNR